MTGRPLAAIAAVAVAGAALAWIGMGDLGENLVYYWSPSELVAAGAKAHGATIRLGGQVEAGTVDWNPDTNQLKFVVTDGQEPGSILSEGTSLRFRVTDGTSAVPVASTGVPPQMFREGIGVVVEGTIKDGQFATDRVMVKHSNEYRAPEDGEKPDIVTLSEDGP
jgi:cytochrome c-type biogenesis protein CcmE